MNTPFIFPQGSVGLRRKPRRGMALILVLAGVILAAGLLVTLLFITKSGRVVSGAYAGQVQTRVLANSALNLVIGQIRDATGDTTMTQTWASQPGAIRVYSTLGGSGSDNFIEGYKPSQPGAIRVYGALRGSGSDNFIEGYKLFSSSVMTVTPTTSLGRATGEAALLQDVEGDGNPVPIDWANEIGKYVNLNQKVTVNGVDVYPIVDPAVLASNGNGSGTPNPQTSITGVQGFSDTDTTDYPNLAMPVEWLYQLQDGTFVPGVYNATNGAVQVGGGAYETPTSTNQIVGRVAFWTDDETSKVNVNTASEGLYWDEPRINTQDVASTINSISVQGGPPIQVSTNTPGPSQTSKTPQYQAVPATLVTAASSNNDNEFPAVGTDQGLASNQPADNEFNRFPGHPATTSLSAVFSELNPVQIFSILPRYSLNGVTPKDAAGIAGAQWINNYSAGQYSDGYGFTGGSVMGTYAWLANEIAVNSNQAGYGASYNSAVLLNANHLYDSAGEVMFQPTRQLNANGGIATTAATGTPLTPATVEQRKFFLTAESRAPELNLFGCPRVSMWPVYGTYNPNPTIGNPNPISANGNPYCSTYDKVAAFCSTLQPSGTTTTYPFYVQRENAYDPNFDMALNTNLFRYLQAMTSQTVPGFGGNFQTKYGSDGDQILTEALDYIRCTNLFDASLEPLTSTWYQFYVQGQWHFIDTANILTSGNEFTEGARKAPGLDFCAGGYPGYGQVVPLKNGTNMGLGRTYTVSQVALQFICTGDYNEGSQGAGNGNPPSNTTSNLTLPTPYGANTTPLAGPGSNVTVDKEIPAGPVGGWQKQVQAILLVELATPMQGYPVLCPSIRCTISGASVFQVSSGSATLNTITLFPKSGSLLTYNNSGTPVNYGGIPPINSVREGYNPWGAYLWNGIGACGYGSIFPFTAVGCYPLAALHGQSQLFIDVTSASVPSYGHAQTQYISYPFISQPFTVTVPGTGAPTLNVTGANLTLQLSYAADGGGNSAGVQPPLSLNGAFNTTDVPYQTIGVNFQGQAIPVPNLVPNDPTKWIFAQYGPSGVSSSAASTGRLAIMGTESGTPSTDTLHNISSFVQLGDSVISYAIKDGDFRLNAAMQSVPTSRFWQVGGNNSTAAATNSLTAGLATTQGSTQTLTTPYVTLMNFPIYYNNANSTSYKVDVSNPSVDGTASTAARFNEGSYVNGVKMPAFCNPEVPSSKWYQGTTFPYTTGDWDNGLAGMPDGPFANMAESGDSLAWYTPTCAPYPTIPYFDCPAYDVSGMQRMFSPNRQMPSPGMFGSLPTGVKAGKPWQTLLFRPQPSHPESSANYPTIPDYLFMDLFWMPVVQPYAISEPFSTAGKINMNYQILPFTYIKRQTGLYAVLKNERMLCIPSTAATTYKGQATAFGTPASGAVQTSDAAAWRHIINVGATLEQFEDRFNGTNVGGQNAAFNTIPALFRAPAEICDLYLVPENGDADGLTAANMSSYWTAHALTGDNTRERPYTVIYPRLTTQSNTYRVHYWVESLRKSPASNPGPAYFVDPGSSLATVTNGLQPDSIRGQLRGSFLIERYLQSDDSRLATWASSNYPAPTSNLNSYYKIRVLGSTDFNPQ